MSGVSGGAVAAGPTGFGGRGVNVAENATTLARAMGAMNRDEQGGTLSELPGVSYDAELWLVHTAPGATAEETQRLPIRVSSGVDVLTFSPVAVQTARGPLNVEVAAVVRVMATTDAKQVLRVVIARSVRGTYDSIGNTTKVIPSPAVGDVVSFEIPEYGMRRGGGAGGRGAAAGVAAAAGTVVSASSNDLLGGHQFSVRLVLKSKANR
jgi:hypothetical protein